ncbi:MAG: nucleotidyltransferase domain-containing protein [Nanoarchaeota archaeon]|nr:nucleotidyltransferase domain-containing protein [Nanoarchaeota archaeon]MBU1622410.1 nucleotidyltransferase domain-containing protein [Nanoarchaeota archaeon]
MKRKNIKTKIKEYFFAHPTTRIRVRQIERAVNVPLPSVLRYTKELSEEEIIKISKIAGIKLFSADRTAKKFLFEKKHFNLQSLISAGLIDFLIDKYSNPTIIIFGSYARGEDTENSDVDIYIETLKKRSLNLTDFEKKIQRKIELFQYKDIRQIKNKELANNILNGTVLNGYLEVFK